MTGSASGSSIGAFVVERLGVLGFNLFMLYILYQVCAVIAQSLYHNNSEMNKRCDHKPKPNVMFVCDNSRSKEFGASWKVVEFAEIAVQQRRPVSVRRANPTIYLD